MKHLLIVTVVCLLAAGTAWADTVINLDDFETDTGDWTGATRVASGTGGVTSAGGSYHATTGSQAYTYFGGYSSVFPSDGFLTSIDIYLDVDGGYSNDTRFDWDSAVSKQNGDHLRDFIFNAGFYNDSDSTGSGNRFVVSASNNSSPGSAYPKNPGRDPYAITSTGWYTFEHKFYDDGGVLAADLSIYDDAGVLQHQWTLSDSGDLISTVVGGNRYGWFSDQDFSALAFDNVVLKTLDAAVVPLPAAAWMGLVLLAGLGGIRRLRGRRVRG